MSDVAARCADALERAARGAEGARARAEAVELAREVRRDATRRDDDATTTRRRRATRRDR
jgi:hypothetical protein